MSTRDKFVAKMKHQLDEWNAEIDSLEAKTHQAKEDARANISGADEGMRD